MSLSQVASFADLLAAIGVIISLLFLAYEVRRNTNEAKKNNWESLIDRFCSLWSRTSSNLELADILDRGRASYTSLTNRDKLVFQNYYLELVLSYEAAVITGDNQILEEGISEVPYNHLRYYFGFPGAKEWWEISKVQAPMSPLIINTIDLVIKDAI